MRKTQKPQEKREGVMIGMRAGGNCVKCLFKFRDGNFSYCGAFGKGREATSKYFRCRYHTDLYTDDNYFIMREGEQWGN